MDHYFAGLLTPDFRVKRLVTPSDVIAAFDYRVPQDEDTTVGVVGRRFVFTDFNFKDCTALLQMPDDSRVRVGLEQIVLVFNSEVGRGECVQSVSEEESTLEIRAILRASSDADNGACRRYYQGLMGQSRSAYLTATRSMFDPPKEIMVCELYRVVSVSDIVAAFCVCEVLLSCGGRFEFFGNHTKYEATMYQEGIYVGTQTYADITEICNREFRRGNQTPSDICRDLPMQNALGYFELPLNLNRGVEAEEDQGDVVFPEDSCNRHTCQHSPFLCLASQGVWSYCWTHGLVRQLYHNSANCKSKAPGHVDKATLDNRLGGSSVINE